MRIEFTGLTLDQNDIQEIIGTTKVERKAWPSKWTKMDLKVGIHFYSCKDEIMLMIDRQVNGPWDYYVAESNNSTFEPTMIMRIAFQEKSDALMFRLSGIGEEIKELSNKF